jgi:peroxiredoxin Q/BCP
MRMSQGSKAEIITLPAIDNTEFKLDSLKGKKVLVTFFRFAGCPFCNLRISQLVKKHASLGDNFRIVAVFDASLKNLQRNLIKHKAPFILLADEKNVFYKSYGVERSIWGVIKGILFSFPQMLYSMFAKGNFLTNIGGNLLTMPASFLINEKGIIDKIYYGKDEFDHIPFEQVLNFAKKTELKEKAEL